MKELINLSNASFDTEYLLQGETGRLETLLGKHQLAGIEFMLCGPWDEKMHPARYIRGVHLNFWPNWLDFWRGDEAALQQEFGGREQWQKVYGGCRAAWLECWRNNLRQAVACGAEYVVFHVAQARTTELYQREFAYAAESVIQAVVDLVNCFSDELPENCQLLFENLWWPGLTFQEPKLAEVLLQGVQHKNTGFMLDTGHLMNTNTKLRTEKDAVAYILKTVEKLGKLRQRIYGMHLHCSLSGEFVEKKRKQSLATGRPVKKLEWQEIMDYILQTDQHRPFHTKEVRKLVEKIEPNYLVHEFIQDSWQDWDEKIKIQRHSLGWE